jgi:SpoIIAA-like
VTPKGVATNRADPRARGTARSLASGRRGDTMDHRVGDGGGARPTSMARGVSPRRWSRVPPAPANTVAVDRGVIRHRRHCPSYDPCVIERIPHLTDGVIGMRAVGTFSVADYAEIVEPEVDRVEAAHEELRLLLLLGHEFEGFGDGAWGDLTKELRGTPFHRGAVVTDDSAIRTGLALLRFSLHGHVRSFGNDDYDKALSWVAG